MIVLSRHADRPQSFVPAIVAGLILVLAGFALASFHPGVDRTQVELPRTLSRDVIPRGAAVISIDRDGALHVSAGDEPSVLVPSVAMAGRLAATALQQDAALPFVIKADKRTRYEVVDLLISALRRSGARSIYLLTEQRLLDGDE